MQNASKLTLILLVGAWLASILWLPRSAAPQHDLPQGDLVQFFSFDEGVGGWTSLDTEAVIKQETDPSQVKVGKGALSFQFTPRKGALSLLSYNNLMIKGANAATFFLKSSEPTVVVFILHERDDSRYQALRYTPAGEWVRHDVHFSDLTLADDASDENDQLDPDQVDAVILADIEVIYAQSAQKTGAPRLMLLDELAFLIAPDRTGDEKLILDDFEDGVGAWFPMQMSSGEVPSFDASALLRATAERGDVKSGRQALEFRYRITPHQFPVLLHQLAGKKLADSMGVRMWVKTDAPTVLVVSLGERGGGRYSTPFFCPGNRYQQVTLKVADFALDDDAKDANGRLDLATVNSLTIADAASFLATHFQGIAAGERTLYLDRLEMLPKTPVERGSGGDERTGREELRSLWQDDFREGVIRWLPLRLNLNPLSISLLTDGTLEIVESPDRAIGAKALQFSYTVSTNSLAVLMRPLVLDKADFARSLHLVLRTDADTTLMVNLKERDESEYRYQLPLGKADGWKDLAIPLTIFKLGEDKTDENNRLDPGQLKEIALADISMGVGNAGRNTLWIESVSLMAD